MYETTADLEDLQRLLDASLARSTDHLRGIIRPERSPTARQLLRALDGMRVLVVATTTAAGEPRTSAADGHLLRGRWVFSTSGTAAKARQLRRRPAVSATHLDGERFAVFTHGRAEEITATHADFGWVDEHMTRHYGSSPSSWGDDNPYFRIQPSWMVGFAADPADLDQAVG